MIVDIKCPKCRSDIIQTRTRMEHGKNWVSIVCGNSNCGHKLTFSEIGWQIRDQTVKLRDEASERSL